MRAGMRLGAIGAAVLAVTGTLVATGATGTATAAPTVRRAAAVQPPVLPVATAKLRPMTMVSGATASPALRALAAPAGAAPITAAAATLSRGDFNALAPVKTLDTRIGLGTPKARLGAGRTITVPIGGRFGVPSSGVAGVLLTVTAVAPSSPGYLSVYRFGAARPSAFTLNYATGQTVSNLTLASVDTIGRVSIFSSGGPVDVTATVSGWYSTTATVHPLPPARLLDTRTGIGGPAQAIALNGTRTVQVTGAGGVPATGVTAAVVNLTSIGATRAGSMALFPTGSAPGAGTLNVPSGAAISNLAVVQLGTGGAITLVNRAGSAHATVDVQGWIGAGGQFHPLAERRYDTRPAGASGPLRTGSWFDFWMTGVGRVPATGVNAITMNITVISPTADGQLLIEPQGNATPVATSISYTKGRTTSTLVQVKIGKGGWIRFNNAGGSVHLVLDTVGWYSADGTLGLAPNQTRRVAPSRTAGITINGVSADGRYSFFKAAAATAPYADANSLYVTDSLLGITQVTVSGFFTPTNSDVSADGTSITFESASPDIWNNDVNAVTDVFWYDLITNDVKLVTANTAGSPVGGNGVPLSSNARYAVFQSPAPGIVANQPAGMSVFVRDLVAGSTTRVGDCLTRLTLCADAVSDDGGRVLFTSQPTAGVFTTFVWNRGTGVASPFLPTQPNVKVTGLSDDGGIASFYTAAALDPADLNGQPDVYTIELGTGTTHLLTHLPDGSTEFASRFSAVSADGTLALFESTSQLAPPPTDLWNQVYRSASTGGPITMVTQSPAGVAGAPGSHLVAMASSGNYAVIATTARALGADTTLQTNYLLIRVR